MTTEEAADVYIRKINIILIIVFMVLTLTSVFLTEITEDLVHVRTVEESLGISETSDTIATFVGTINSSSIIKVS